MEELQVVDVKLQVHWVVWYKMNLIQSYNTCSNIFLELASSTRSTFLWQPRWSSNLGILAWAKKLHSKQWIMQSHKPKPWLHPHTTQFWFWPQSILESFCLSFNTTLQRLLEFHPHSAVPCLPWLHPHMCLLGLHPQNADEGNPVGQKAPDQAEKWDRKKAESQDQGWSRVGRGGVSSKYQ